MTMIFFEADKLKNLSNIELINKRQELEEQLSSVKKNIVSSDILNSMNMILEYYTNEIDVRIALGTLDMDEIEELEEEAEDNQDELSEYKEKMKNKKAEILLKLEKFKNRFNQE